MAVIVSVVLILMTIAIALYSRAKAKGLAKEAEKKAIYLTAQIEAKDRQIGQLKGQMDRLSELNQKYIAFMLKIPEVTKRLNSQLDFDEIILTVAGLIRDILDTETVEFYFATEGRLKRLYPASGDVFLAEGEGLVGRAARDRIIKIKGVTDKGLGVTYTKADSKLWIAVPVQFHDILIGVIAIGDVTHRTGNEKDILKLIADIAAVALTNQRVLDGAKKEASTDALTGLFNRRYFFALAHRQLHRAMEDGMPVSFFMFDIDNFKNYNDLNGHPEGDNLLRTLSGLLMSVTRKNAYCARYGGEEFVVMLPSATKDEALLYAERFRELVVAHPFPHRERQPLGFVSISGGVSTFPSDGKTVEMLIKAADDALYEAKRTGRNRILKCR